MRGFTRTLGVCLAAVLFTSHTWAGVISGEPAANLILSFDDNNDVSATSGQTSWFESFPSGGETPSSYLIAPKRKGFVVKADPGKAHPWVGMDAKSIASCALYADISGVETANASKFLVAFGNKNGHIALMKTAANTVQVWQNKAVIAGTASDEESTAPTLSVESSALAAGYHLFVFGYNGSSAFLSVDGAEPVTVSTQVAQPNAGFQIGSIFEGLWNTSNGEASVAQGYGMKVDEVRGYDSVLSATQIDALKRCFPVEVLIDATTSAFTASDADETAYAAYSGTVTLLGSGETGTTLTYGNSAPQLNCKLVFDGGTHKLTYGGTNVNQVGRQFGPAGTDEAPTLEVKGAATLNFEMKDLSGWTSTTDSPSRVVRVREGATLNFLQSSAGSDKTAYFSNRLVLDNGAVVNVQTTDEMFRLHGGSTLTADKAQIAMLGGESETAATITGNVIKLPKDATVGVTVAVGPKATLTIDNAFTVDTAGRTLSKVGDGTLVLSGKSLTGVNVEVNEGIVDLKTNRPNALKLAEGATVKVSPTVSEIAQGELTLALAEGSSALSESNLEISGGTITEVSGGTVTFSSLVNTWMVADGATSGAWSDGARWSRGSKPAEGEVARVLLRGDVTLTVDEAATLADLWVVGTGKLTLDGEQRLTVRNKLVVEATELVASAATLAPAATEIAREATFTYENGAVNMPSLTGEGTFAKTGTAQLTLLAGNTYEPAIVVSGGTLLFDDAAHTQAYRVRVKNGATVQVGTWTGGLTNSSASLTLEAGGTLSLPNGNSDAGSSTVAASITVDSGATAENPAIIKAGNYGNNARITGAIGSSGETAGALRFDKVAENHLTIAGNVANVHLINNTLVKLTVSGAISGGGSVTVKGGEIALTGTNSYTGATTIEKGGTLTLSGGADALTCNTSEEAKVTVNGKLQAQNNGTAPTTYYRKTEGEGEIYVPANQTLAIGLTNNAGESGLTGFTGTLRVAGTFDARNWKENTTYTISGFDVAFEGRDGVITKFSTAESAAVTIAAGKTLSGSGTIELPTTFAAGAVIDARSESGTVYSTLSGDVNLPEGKVKVLANAYGPVLGKAGLDITKFAVAEGGTLTEGVFAPVGAYLYVVQKPTVPSGTDAAAAEAIARAALQSGASFTQVTEASAATGCQVDGAALFDNVVKFTAATGSLTEATALVSYDFGISKMVPTTVDGSTTVTVSAKVAGRETGGAQITAGTRLQLLAEGVEAPLAEKTVDAAAEEVAFDAVAAGQLIGKRLSVRATK